MTGASGGPIHPDQIETPLGYVDLDRARSNAVRVVAYATEHGLGWRPHIKTHKSLAIARLQLEVGARGLTVATLREAEVMSELTDDLLVAYPPVGHRKLQRLLALPERLDLKVALDSAEVLTALGEAAAGKGREVGVLVEQDMGMRRVGLPSSEAVVALSRLASEMRGVRFRGVMFYPGHIRMAEGEQGAPIEAVSARMQATLSALRAEGLDPEIVSGGSTPTVWRSHEMQGLTEIRAGSCIFYDREGMDIGVADLADVAYTVMATVVSTAVPGQVVVDAGSKALAREARGTGDGFGMVLDHPEVTVSGVSEEHGVLDISQTSWRPAVGDRVRIVPNHVCVSVNLQDQFLAVEGNRHSVVVLEGRGRGLWGS